MLVENADAMFPVLFTLGNSIENGNIGGNKLVEHKQNHMLPN